MLIPDVSETALDPGAFLDLLHRLGAAVKVEHKHAIAREIPVYGTKILNELATGI